MDKQITFIDETDISNKTVLLRADFDVSLRPDQTIADDVRIRKNIPTLNYLLKRKNKVICVAKMDRPKERNPKLSLKIVTERLQNYLPDVKIRLISDFLTDTTFNKQKAGEVLVLENIRFYPEEKANDPKFAKKLASLADVYVNDSFAMCHRKEASIVGVPQFLPSFGGLLLKEEISMLQSLLKNPQKPFVAIVGGAKIADKIDLIKRLIEIADYVLIGGGLANTFIRAKGYQIGRSIYEEQAVEKARQLFYLAAERTTALILPSDAVVGNPDNLDGQSEVHNMNEIPENLAVYDIGPKTCANFGKYIALAKTIVWNGPVGFFEHTPYRRGTDFIYYAIAQNDLVKSIVGGGDTLAAISKKDYLEKITHISTGGGAMLEFIKNGTLPGIEALKQ
jgi:phosphoglycerate kinase